MEIRVWNVLTGFCETIFTHHTGPVNCLVITNTYLISASYDGSIFGVGSFEGVNVFITYGSNSAQKIHFPITQKDFIYFEMLPETLDTRSTKNLFSNWQTHIKVPYLRVEVIFYLLVFVQYRWCHCFLCLYAAVEKIIR